MSRPRITFSLSTGDADTLRQSLQRIQATARHILRALPLDAQAHIANVPEAVAF